MVTIVKRKELKRAWAWLRAGVPSAPPHNGVLLYNDLSGWSDASGNRLLNSAGEVPSTLASLYLASQLGNISSILDFVNEVSPASSIRIEQLDEDVRKVVSSKTRFRAALSEHLAFWVRAAYSPVLGSGKRRLAMQQPNMQPEDKGPDGLCLELGSRPRAEVLSVKNSINSPLSLIRSGSMGSHGVAKGKAMLDDFQRMRTKGLGITRLQRSIVQLVDYAQVSYDERIQAGLLVRAAMHGIVVADHKHADVSLFAGFAHIKGRPRQRKCTYIGSVRWSDVAEGARSMVIKKFQQCGVW